MVKLQFSSTKKHIESLIDESITIRLTKTDSTADEGDLNTVATHVDLPETTPVKKRTIEFVGRDSDTIYAKSIYVNYMHDQFISLFDWIEVIPEYRGEGISRTLIEDTLRHIDSKTPTVDTYLKLEAPIIRGILIDTGFQEIEVNPAETWLVR